MGKTIKIGATSQVTQQTSEAEVKIVGVQNASVVGMGSAWMNDKAGELIEDITMAGLPDEYRNQANAIVAQLDDNHIDSEAAQKVKDELEGMGYSSMTLTDTVSMIKSFFDAITTVPNNIWCNFTIGSINWDYLTRCIWRFRSALVKLA